MRCNICRVLLSHNHRWTLFASIGFLLLLITYRFTAIQTILGDSSGSDISDFTIIDNNADDVKYSAFETRRKFPLFKLSPSMKKKKAKHAETSKQSKATKVLDSSGKGSRVWLQSLKEKYSIRNAPSDTYVLQNLCAEKGKQTPSMTKLCAKMPQFLIGPDNTGTSVLLFFLEMHPSVEHNLRNPDTS